MNQQLDEIYRRRWTAQQDLALQRVWQVLVADYFQSFVNPGSTVLDLAAGRCNFINNIKAGRRIAFDGTQDCRRHAAPGVEVIVSTDLTLPGIQDAELDHVFISNFLEHLQSAEVVLNLLGTVFSRLRPGGTVLILQPNIRYVGVKYFDFIDHQMVLTEKSLVEALEVNGFAIQHLVKQFLPYTAKSNLPTHPSLVRAYLKLPLLWRILGEQTFVIGLKR